MSDSYSYNGFGEIQSYQATMWSTLVARWAYQRDKLGRITQKLETVNGTTSTFDYAYDTAGRLIEVKLNGVVQSSYGYDDNGTAPSSMARPLPTMTPRIACSTTTMSLIAIPTTANSKPKW